jgi:hypothetical protein
VGTFLQRAEEILETAFHGENDQDILIVMERQGGMRVLESAGWTLPAAAAEYGASAVYHVERRRETVRVEGFCGNERCLLQRDSRKPTWGLGLPAQAMMLQTSALALG